ncbi:MAG: PilZ domain-containing protein [Phycisphaeraceae bacterium]|nr:PilZ domain-containing protein [Phycisphaeraceae bacterium]
MPANNIQPDPIDTLQPMDDAAAGIETLRFERRQSHRFETIGQVEAVRMGPPEALIEPKLELKLIDESITGAGFRSEAPLSPGTMVEVRIGPASAPWKSGRVVRCVATERGYRVGVEYGRRLAA